MASQPGKPDDDSLAIALLGKADEPQPVIDFGAIIDAAKAARADAAAGTLTSATRAKYAAQIRAATHGIDDDDAEEEARNVEALGVRR